MTAHERRHLHDRPHNVGPGGEQVGLLAHVYVELQLRSTVIADQDGDAPRELRRVDPSLVDLLDQVVDIEPVEAFPVTVHAVHPLLGAMLDHCRTGLEFIDGGSFPLAYLLIFIPRRARGRL
jgi:hypothetical protein